MAGNYSRKDPADPTPVAAHPARPSNVTPVEDLVRRVVADLVAKNPQSAELPDEPTEEELLQLEEESDDLVVTDHQVRDMRALEVAQVVDRFDQALEAVRGLSEAERQRIVQSLYPEDESGENEAEAAS